MSIATVPFSPSQFTPTQWDTAEDKARFANHAVRFIESGFNPNLFHSWFYRRLSNCFGHIAHYNQAGFYGEWFADDARRLEWLRYVAAGGAYTIGDQPVPVGDPACTYADVEVALMNWVLQAWLTSQYGRRVSQATECWERAELARLKTKYPEAT